MSDFADKVRPETPRLVVMYKREGDQEKFQWGVVGTVPVLSLVGAVCIAQGTLCRDEWLPECPESALVIAWDEDGRGFDTYVSPAIPVAPLVGMLETIKAVLVGTHMARQAAAQQLILGPDGRPVRR